MSLRRQTSPTKRRGLQSPGCTITIGLRSSHLRDLFVDGAVITVHQRDNSTKGTISRMVPFVLCSLNTYPWIIRSSAAFHAFIRSGSPPTSG